MGENKEIKADPVKDKANWRSNFDERQLKEIRWADVYAKQFAHGTTGHNDLLIISKTMELLDAAYAS